MYQFKEKDSEIKPYPLCLGNTSKDFTLDNTEKKKINKGKIVILLILAIF